MRLIALLPLALLASCTKPLPLDGHPCPCVRGYRCDTRNNICVRGDLSEPNLHCGPFGDCPFGETCGSDDTCHRIDNPPDAAPADHMSNAANPVGFSYESTTNIGAFSAPTGMLVAGRCNREHSDFAIARDAGAEVIAYLNPVDIPGSNHTNCPGPEDQEFYMGDVAVVPKWGKDGSGEWRINRRQSDGTPTYIANIRAGSQWTNHVVKYIEQLIVENRVDGVLLDVLGARLWSGTQASTSLPLARWDEWSDTEREDWTRGAVDLVRRLDASRRRLNPDFVIVNNNIWEGRNVDVLIGWQGEQHVDGICLENPNSRPEVGTYHVNYVGRVFGNLGHRRVLVIKRDDPDTPYIDAAMWATIPGVTHVSPQSTYLSSGTPVVGFEALEDRERPRTLGKTSHSTDTHLLTFNIKRASRFTFPQGGRVLRFGAYLDGQGESDGPMTLRVVLYTDGLSTDNVPRPHSVVVQSADVTIQFGQAVGWVNFPVISNVSIAPGNYWLSIHGGPPGGTGREYADGPDNCYEKDDQFDDGTSPWGESTGRVCTGTLSVYAMVAN